MVLRYETYKFALIPSELMNMLPTFQKRGRCSLVGSIGLGIAWWFCTVFERFSMYILFTRKLHFMSTLHLAFTWSSQQTALLNFRSNRAVIWIRKAEYSSIHMNPLHLPYCSNEGIWNSVRCRRNSNYPKSKQWDKAENICRHGKVLPSPIFLPWQWGSYLEIEGWNGQKDKRSISRTTY